MIDDFLVSKSLLDKLNEIVGLPEISIDGKSYTPKVDTPYIREFVLRGPSNNIGLAYDARKRQDGIYQVDVCTPKGAGRWQNLKICKQIKDVFVQGLKLTNEGQNIMIVKCDVNPSYSEKDFYVTPNSIYFTVIN